MTRLWCLCFLPLYGCASIPQEPIIKTVEVTTVLREKCQIQTPSVPKFPVQSLPIGADIYDQVVALLNERNSRQAYEARLSAALMACKQ